MVHYTYQWGIGKNFQIKMYPSLPEDSFIFSNSDDPNAMPRSVVSMFAQVPDSSKVGGLVYVAVSKSVSIGMVKITEGKVQAPKL